MILVDSSVWVDHFRNISPQLAALLERGEVLCHPFVIAELALGNLRQRAVVIAALRDLPAALVATDDEVLDFIETHALYGRGIGHTDVHLLASTRLSPGTRLWTKDKRLEAVVHAMGLTFAPA